MGNLKYLLWLQERGGCKQCPRCLPQGLAGDGPKAVLLLHLHLVPGAAAGLATACSYSRGHVSWIHAPFVGQGLFQAAMLEVTRWPADTRGESQVFSARPDLPHGYLLCNWALAVFKNLTYLVLLHFTLLCFANIAFSSTWRRDPPQAKGFRLSEGPGEG